MAFFGHGLARAWAGEVLRQACMSEDTLTQLSHCSHNCCKLLAHYLATIQDRPAGFGFFNRSAPARSQSIKPNPDYS
jgi:hypothetical protein